MPDRACQQTMLAWLACAICVMPLSAAEAELGADRDQTYRTTRWTTDQGMPQNRISCLKQTHDGYLWLGTWFGLARFDGVRFTVFDKYNTPELVNDAINAVAEDTEGTLWIATADGLVGYREHRFRRLTTADGLPDQRVWRLAASRSGGVWLQAGDSVTRLEGSKFSQTWAMHSAENNMIHELREGADGELHVIMGQTWLTLSPKADELRTNSAMQSVSNERLTGLPGNSAHGAWAGTRQGLRRWDQGSWKTAGAEQFGQRSVDFLYEDHSTNLWVNANHGGLYRQDQASWKAVDVGESAAPVSTTCMEEDREGNLWLGTDQGLVQLQKRRVRTYTTRDGLSDDNVWSVCEGTDGAIWVGANRGLSRIQNGRVTALAVDDPSPEHQNRCVWPARGGGVLIAKPHVGIFELGERFIQILGENTVAKPSLLALYQDRAGRLWTGTGNGVAVLKDGQVTDRYTNWAGKSGYDVRCILEDRAGTFWFGTQGQGLTRLREGKFEVFTQRDGLSNNRVWSIHEDADGALWLGTENGLTRYRQGRFCSLTRQQGLLENAINCILEDDFGYLWLSGLRGIYRVKLEQLNAVAEGRAREVQCAAFGTADGMESSETNGESQPSGWKARDGRLWFPTVRGVVVIDPKTIEIPMTPPPVVLEQVKADEAVIFGDGATRSKAETRDLKWDRAREGAAAEIQPVKLGPGRARVIEFHYTANTFLDPRRARFRYRLEGHDGDWRDETDQRVAHYTNLRPGKYRFEVTAANHHGVWSPTPATFAFTLEPHFYETWPFYLLSAAATVGLAAGVQTYRLRWQRQLLKLDEQRALANERTRIARDLHDDLGTALTGLALELDVAGREAQRGGPLTERLSETARHTRDLAERMREVVWTVNPRCDTVSSLAGFLEQQVHQFLRADGLRVHLDFPEYIPEVPLGAEARHELALSVREALTNVVRHARASEVTLSLAILGQSLLVQVKDNGQGFQPGERVGHGLANMRARIEQIGGAFDCSSTRGAGTTIAFRLPITNSGAAGPTSL